MGDLNFMLDKREHIQQKPLVRLVELVESLGGRKVLVEQGMERYVVPR